VSVLLVDRRRFNGVVVHLQNHDSPSPLYRAHACQAASFKQRMGWTFPGHVWESDFNNDFAVRSRKNNRVRADRIQFRREPPMSRIKAGGQVRKWQQEAPKAQSSRLGMTGTDVPTYTRAGPASAPS